MNQSSQHKVSFTKIVLQDFGVQSKIKDRSNIKESPKKLTLGKKNIHMKEEISLNLKSTPFYSPMYRNSSANPMKKDSTPNKTSSTSEITNDTGKYKCGKDSFSPQDYIKSFEELFIEVSYIS